jgi:hypothetical protein
MDKRNNESITRRRLLGSIGVGAVMVGGISAVSARSSETINNEVYEADSLSKAFVEDHAQPVLDDLVRHGFLEVSSVEQLPLGTPITERAGLTPDEERDGFAVTSVEKDGELTSHLAIKHTAANHEIGVYIQPEQESSYAIAVDDSGTETIVEPSISEPLEATGSTKIATALSNRALKLPPASCKEFCQMYTYRKCVDGGYDCEWVVDTRCEC